MLPADHQNRHARMEYDFCRLGIDPDIELRSRSNISHRARRAAHHVDAPKLGGNVRRLAQSHRYVGERPKRYQRVFAGLPANRAHKGVCGVFFLRSTYRGGIIHSSHAVGTVEEISVTGLANKRAVASGVYRRVLATEFDDGSRVARTHLERNVTGNGGDSVDLNIGRAKRH